MVEQEYKVLLVEDDEDDYALVNHLLQEIKSPRFELTWVQTPEEAVAGMCGNTHDIVLMDYKLGGRSGVQLLAEAKERGMRTPAVLLTGFGDHDVDLRAMAAGAADYIEKRQVTSALLERSIRYAVENARINRMLHALSRKVLSAQEDERRYLAKELHDSIGASLTAIKLTLDRKLQTMKAGKSIDEVLIEDIISMVQRAIRETKQMQQALRPPVIDDLGIIIAVRSLCREFHQANPSIDIQPIFHAEEQKIPEHLKIVVYRISQEALNNIIKHSGADKVSVTVSLNEDDLELLIEDNGTGFDVRGATEGARGMGLASMKERAEYSGGIFSINSNKGEGTLIRVYWPPEHILSCEAPFSTSAREAGVRGSHGIS